MNANKKQPQIDLSKVETLTVMMQSSIDNELKYRYIKMKGEATPQRIYELEDLFEINRDNVKIRQMNKDVESYERAVKEKATLDEQARLRQQEAEKLNHEAEKIKKK
ncbi:MAG: hypothetical protein RRY72_08525 [Bacteroides sp.]